PPPAPRPQKIENPPVMPRTIPVPRAQKTPSSADMRHNPTPDAAHPRRASTHRGRIHSAHPLPHAPLRSPPQFPLLSPSPPPPPTPRRFLHATRRPLPHFNLIRHGPKGSEQSHTICSCRGYRSRLVERPKPVSCPGLKLPASCR